MNVFMSASKREKQQHTSNNQRQLPKAPNKRQKRTLSDFSAPLGEPGTIDASKSATRIRGKPKQLPVRSRRPAPRARRLDTSPTSPASWYPPTVSNYQQKWGSCSVMLGGGAAASRHDAGIVLLSRAWPCSSHSQQNCHFIDVMRHAAQNREKQVRREQKSFCEGEGN